MRKSTITFIGTNNTNYQPLINRIKGNPLLSENIDIVIVSRESRVALAIRAIKLRRQAVKRY